MNPEQSFGRLVRGRRRELDLTQEELARRVGCAAITIRKIEADDARPSVQIAERLAMALNIPLEERANFVRQARAARPEPPLIETPTPALDEIGREDLTGRAIHGYALAEKIGLGGMGAIYRAIQPNVEREVAIKIILPAYANHPDFIRRFEAEAQLVARLEHPHIVPLYDYWREPGVAYLVMRLLRGGSVQTLLQQGPLPLDVVTRLLEQICPALHAAHRIGIIHRDLKPANVLLDEDQNAYLADFGIAKNLGNPDLDAQTQVDAIIGSPAYISPEQVRSLAVRPQTDIYCLGVMLYEMLTGALPFVASTPFELLHQQITMPMPPLAARREGLPAGLDDVIGRAAAKDPEERYPDLPGLLDDFRRAVQGTGSEVGGSASDQTHAHRPQPLSEPVNPYKGLRAFGEGDSADFFGRETLVQQLLARLGEGGDLARFLAVVGPSGSGKSSVVGAGLLPALRRGGLVGSENWFIVTMIPGPHPFEELEAALLRVAVNPPPSLLAQLKDGDRGIVRAVNRILPASTGRDSGPVELVLIIDQFEEVFTLVTDETERARLLSGLVAAVLDERSRVRVIITLRADFTDRPLRYVDFGELVQKRSELVLALTPDELEQAIHGPAKRAGLQLEAGLTSVMIRAVGDQPGALPLLQYALTELFEKRAGRTLTKEAYQSIGGVLGALGRRAEDVFVSLAEAGQSAAKQLFLRLVTLGEGVEDTRRRVLRTELEALTDSIQDPQSKIQNVIDAFGQHRLLSFDRDPITREPTIEVAHEALLREWGRLREWIDLSRASLRQQRQLSVAAREWQHSSRDPGFLLSGARLTQFENLAAYSAVALTQDERAYLEASLAERDRRTAAEAARQERELAAARKLAETEKARAEIETRRAEEQALSAHRMRQRNRVITAVGIIATGLAILAGLFGLQASQNATIAQANAATARAANGQAVTQQTIAESASTQAVAEAHNAATQQAVALLNAERADGLRLGADANALLQSPGGDAELAALLSLRGLQKTYSAQADAALSQALSRLYARLVFAGHTRAIFAAAFSPDGKYVATASADGTVRLWDAGTGLELRMFKGHTAPPRAAAFSPDGRRLLTGGQDETARLWDVETGQELLALNQTGWAESVGFSPDGKYLFTNSLTASSGQITIWDAGTGQEVRQFAGDSRAAFSPAGRYALATGREGASLLDLETGEELQRFVFLVTNNKVPTAAFSADGKYLLLPDGELARLYDLETGQELRAFAGHTGPVNVVAFSPDSRQALTGGSDHVTKLWDVETGEPIRVFLGHTDEISSVAFSPDRQYILTGSWDGTARLWHIGPQTQPRTFVSPSAAISAAALSPDGNYLLLGSRDGTLSLRGLQGNDDVRQFTGHTSIVNTAAFSNNGQYALTASDDQTARLWEVATGKVLQEFAHTDPVFAAAFSADGQSIVTGSGDDQAILWDALSGQRQRAITISSLFGVAFSPDGQYILTGLGSGRTLVLWDARSGSQVRAYIGHSHIVDAVAFSADGQYVVSGSRDQTARLWKAGVTGKELQIFTGHTGAVTAAAFSPDGRFILTGSADKTARLWDAQTGQQLRLLAGQTGAILDVAFSPDAPGEFVLIASADGTVRLWDVDYGDAIHYACSLLVRDLTPPERTAYGITESGPTCLTP